MKVELSKATVMLIASLVITSKVGVSYAMYDNTLVNNKIDTLSNVNSTQKDGIANIRNLISSEFGSISTLDALEAILEDSRGTCIGSLRCAVALSTNNLIETEGRFTRLGLDHKKIGDYVLSISGDSNKSRLLLIANNNGGHKYIEDKVKTYADIRYNEMRFIGLQSEMKIASSIKIAEIGKYTAVVMNPHPDESMGVMTQGLALLNQAEQLIIR